jgi:polyisoprenoid-binding protein YceI
MKRRTALFATVAALVSLSAIASAKFVDAGGDEVRALARGPAGLKINCKAQKIDVKETDGTVELDVPLKGLNTGNGVRDGHFEKYFNVKKHPSAKFKIARSKLKLPEDGKTVKSTATGDFTLNGVTKPVKIRYKAKRTGSDYHVQGLASINITDFKVELPCYLKVCVKDEVKLSVKFKTRDK